jgi:DNA-binding MarR family transcriptional regulator
MNEQPARLAEALLGASRELVAIAIRTVGAGPVPLTVIQHRVLVLLEEAGTLTVNEVGGRLGVNQSNASRHCSFLARRGLVDRTRAEHDQRVVEIRLTDAGRRQVEAVSVDRRQRIDAVLSRMSQTDATAVVQGLEAFAAAARTVDEDDVRPD